MSRISNRKISNTRVILQTVVVAIKTLEEVPIQDIMAPIMIPNIDPEDLHHMQEPTMNMETDQLETKVTVEASDSHLLLIISLQVITQNSGLVIPTLHHPIMVNPRDLLIPQPILREPIDCQVEKL